MIENPKPYRVLVRNAGLHGGSFPFTTENGALKEGVRKEAQLKKLGFTNVRVNVVYCPFF